jgi:hypothetical protein
MNAHSTPRTRTPRTRAPRTRAITTTVPRVGRVTRVAMMTFSVLTAVTLRLAASTAPAHGRANVVTVTARDYAFEAPDTLPAGLTTIRLVSRGQDLHHLLLVELKDGKAPADLLGALKPEGPLPTWAKLLGGPNAPAPGGESNATLSLRPGHYAILCVIPAPDGVPHVAKGMVRPLTVVPARGAQALATRRDAALPAADVTLTLRDYGFEFSKPLTPGKHVIRVRNAAAQPHEVEFFRVAPGKSIQDFLAWERKRNGPPPAIPLGGVNGLERGAENNVALELTPGEYGMICFFPDANDGQPHFAHGMVKQFTVSAAATQAAPH